MNDIYNKIIKQFEIMSKIVDANAKKTDTGWYLPRTSMIVASECPRPWDNINESNKAQKITIDQLTWRGNDFSEFESALSKELFYVISNYFSPENFIFQVYKKHAGVDGDNGFTDCERFFLKIGNALKYAQSLIDKDFTNKTKEIHFPELRDRAETNCYDSHSYADAIVITCHKTE